MAEDAGAWAQALLDSPAGALCEALAAPGAPSPREAAWAFKELCYAAWSTEPAQARPCAQRVDEIGHLAPGDSEVLALGSWTSGIAALTEGRMAEALQALGHAHGGFVGIGQVQHAAQTLVPQMVALAMLGRDAEAVQTGERALALFAQVGDDLAAGKVELNLGTMLSRQDRHADAARQYQRAAVRFARLRALEPSVLADLGLANALTWQFDFPESERITQRALMRAETHGLRVPAALAHLGLGRLHLLAGRYHLALRALVRASRMLAQAGAAPQQRLEADAALADAYLALNLLPEAVALYDRLLQLADDLGAPTERARALLERARAQAQLGLLALAEADLQAARALFQAAGNAASVAGADLVLAAHCLAHGKAAEALQRSRAAGLALADSGIVVWQLEAAVLEAMALAQADQADGAAAIFKRLLVDAQALPAVLLSSHMGLARLASLAGDRPSAKGHVDAALRGVEEARALLPADEFRASVAAAAEQAQRLWLQLALEDGDAAAVLAAMERGRARALHLGLQHPAGPATGDARGTQLQWLRQRWREAVYEGQSQRAADWVRRTRALEAELLEEHRRHLLASVDAPGNRTPDGRGQAFSPHGQAPADFDPVALQGTLQPAEAFVAYHLQGAEIVACVVTARNLCWMRWAAEDVQARVQGLHFQLSAVKFARAALAPHGELLLQRVLAHLQALHRLVWAPLKAVLHGCTRVAVVPHRQLHYLPFGALHDGRQWLMEQLEIELVPSAAIWVAAAGRAAARQRHPQPPVRLLALGAAGPGLPHVDREMQAVATAHGGGAVCLQGAEATGQALRNHLGGPDAANVLHMACHGEFRADSPAFSALHLADGPLALHELSDLRMDVRLVVLSACDTGQSRAAPGDEVLGLVRGFMLAGAQQVLATLWAVDDEATSQLMGAFHRRLATGERAAAALRGAQCELAGQGLHPFFWAAWALHGKG